jgi:hypothetical protein
MVESFSRQISFAGRRQFPCSPQTSARTISTERKGTRHASQRQHSSVLLRAQTRHNFIGYMNNVMKNLVEVLNYHSSEYVLIKQGERTHCTSTSSIRLSLFSVDVEHVHRTVLDRHARPMSIDDRCVRRDRPNEQVDTRPCDSNVSTSTCCG